MYDVNSTTKEEKISYVRFVVNKDIAYTKVFDNQWFSAEFVDIGDETKPTLISDIHFNTKNQKQNLLIGNRQNREKIHLDSQ